VEGGLRRGAYAADRAPATPAAMFVLCPGSQEVSPPACQSRLVTALPAAEARPTPPLSRKMDATHLILLFLAVGVIAFLYSSVGHAGASGYIAVMALWRLAPPVIRPTALVLNISVATIGAFQFWRAGYFDWKLFWPFALLSVPAAYLGGYKQLPASILKILISGAAFLGRTLRARN
jgi:hypothetical protein